MQRTLKGKDKNGEKSSGTLPRGEGWQPVQGCPDEVQDTGSKNLRTEETECRMWQGSDRTPATRDVKKRFPQQTSNSNEKLCLCQDIFDANSKNSTLSSGHTGLHRLKTRDLWSSVHLIHLCPLPTCKRRRKDSCPSRSDPSWRSPKIIHFNQKS